MYNLVHIIVALCPKKTRRAAKRLMMKPFLFQFRTRVTSSHQYILRSPRYRGSMLVMASGRVDTIEAGRDCDVHCHRCPRLRPYPSLLPVTRCHWQPDRSGSLDAAAPAAAADPASFDGLQRLRLRALRRGPLRTLDDAGTQDSAGRSVLVSSPLSVVGCLP